MFTEKQLFKKAVGIFTVLLFSGASFGWADMSAAAVDELVKTNKELMETVSKLTKKVDQLETRVAQTETRQQVIPVSGAVAAPSPEGGVVRTIGGDIQMSGFVDTSFNWNFATPGVPTGGTNSTGNTTLRAFDRESDTFDLNNLQLNFKRPAPDKGGVGFNSEFTYGTDAGVIQSAPFDTTSSLSIQEAYVEGKFPIGSGLTVWAGKFATLNGAEVIENYQNWNASRSFLFNLAIPFTHTGVRAFYNWLGGKVSTALGIVNGWDNVIDNNKMKDVEAQVKWVPNENFNIVQNFLEGSPVVDDISDTRYLFDTVATWKPLPKDLPKLTLMGNYDYGTQERLSKGPGGKAGPPDWQGYALYAKYDVNDWLTLAARWEQFWDDEGVRTGTFSLNNLYEMTYTADVKVYKNLLTRFEYRHDYGNSNRTRGNRGPFDGASRRDQDTAGVSLVYLFA